MGEMKEVMEEMFGPYDSKKAGRKRRDTEESMLGVVTPEGARRRYRRRPLRPGRRPPLGPSYGTVSLRC